MKTFKEMVLESVSKLNKIEVASDYEDGQGPVNVRVKDKSGAKYLKLNHWYNEYQGHPDDLGPDERINPQHRADFIDHLKKVYKLSDSHAAAVEKHIHRIVHSSSPTYNVHDFDHVSDVLPSDGDNSYAQKTYHKG